MGAEACSSSGFAGHVEHGGRWRLHAAQLAAQSPQSKATLQQLMATALLHLGGYDDAANVIEQTLAEDPYPHLAELYKRLYNMLDTGLAYEQQRRRTSPESARLSFKKSHVEMQRRLTRLAGPARILAAGNGGAVLTASAGRRCMPLPDSPAGADRRSSSDARTCLPGCRWWPATHR
jgi:hypothetical protein